MKSYLNSFRNLGFSDTDIGFFFQMSVVLGGTRHILPDEVLEYMYHRASSSTSFKRARVLTYGQERRRRKAAQFQ